MRQYERKIMRNGGVYEDQIENECRYWVTLADS